MKALHIQIFVPIVSERFHFHKKTTPTIFVRVVMKLLVTRSDRALWDTRLGTHKFSFREHRLDPRVVHGGLDILC